jgi:MFS family permease
MNGPALRTFYALAVTQTLSLIGSRMSSIAVGIWVFTETNSTAPLLLVAFFNEVPAMIGGSLAGVLADRWDRRWVMALADAGQALGTLALLGSIAAGAFELCTCMWWRWRRACSPPSSSPPPTLPSRCWCRSAISTAPTASGRWPSRWRA